MITTLSISLFAIFTALSLIHFYWLFGGRWGAKKVIPTKNDEGITPSIPRFATLIVALGLLLMGLIYLVKSGQIVLELPEFLTTYAYWVIPSLFMIRAIGDFNYVGFFKKIKNTEFAKADSRWFSPLCLLIAVFGVLIQVLNR